MIEEFLRSRTGIIILSIIWGLGLATLFKRSCDGKGCRIIQLKGPPIAETREAYWRYGTEDCYKLTPEITTCK